ncbi:MAG: tetratricopeptide repeat protein [Chlorobiota bacterium]
MKYILISILLFFSTSIADAQWAILKSDADSLVRQGADYIYNVQFDSAEVAFEEVIRRYPEHPAGYFLQAMVDWWRITLYRYTEKIDEDFLEKIDKVIEVSEVLLDENEYDITGLFFKGGALGYRARYYSNHKEWFSAASDGKEAYDILMKAHLKAPGNHDIMLGTGLYNYFAVAIPEDYPLLKPVVLFFPKGNKRLGLLQLRASMNKARYTSVEAEVTLMQIYYSFEKDFDQAFYYANDLFTRFPRNPYFHRYLGRTYVKLGKWDKIESTWREVVKRCLRKEVGYDNMTAREGLYYVGIALQRKSEHDMAIKYLKKSVDVSEYVDGDEETGFLSSALLKIGISYRKKNDLANAKLYFNKVLDVKDYNNNHDKAENYLSKLNS